MTLKMRGTIDKHVDEFTELIEICHTPTREAYAFFFISVSQYLKGKLSEEFPESDPVDMKEVYKCARKHEIAEKWATGKQDKPQHTPVPNEGKKYKGKPAITGNGINDKSKGTVKDPNAANWGPAQKGEGRLYRDNDRCCKCGKKPWSDPSHPCRQFGAKAPSKEDGSSKN